MGDERKNDGLTPTTRSPQGYHPLLESARTLEVLALLDACGFQQIGGGDDALVYARPASPWVLRVGRSPACFSLFVDLCRSDDNPHFPTIWGYFEDREHSACCMELLVHIPKVRLEVWHQVNAFSGLAWAIADDRPFLPAWYGGLTPNMIDAATKLGKTALERNLALDFCSGNIFWRRERQELVVSDPWAKWGD